MPMAMRKPPPPKAMTFECSSIWPTSAVRVLLRMTSMISLTHTPATKLNPPLCPLSRLCLMMVKIIGPTDKARTNPSANPFKTDSIITIALNAPCFQELLPVQQHFSFQYTGELMLSPDLSFKAHKFHKLLFREHLDIDVFHGAVPFDRIVVIQLFKLVVDLPA